MQITITGNDDVIRRFAERLSSDRLKIALSVAVNDTARQTKVQTARDVARFGSIDKPSVEKNLSVRFASNGGLEAVVAGHGKPISMSHFRPVQTAKGVTATVWGKRQFYRDAFISDHIHGVYARTSKARLPIHRLYGAGVAQVMAEPEVLGGLNAFAQQRLNINTARQLDRFTAGAGGVNR